MLGLVLGCISEEDDDSVAGRRTPWRISRSSKSQQSASAVRVVPHLEAGSLDYSPVTERGEGRIPPQPGARATSSAEDTVFPTGRALDAARGRPALRNSPAFATAGCAGRRRSAWDPRRQTDRYISVFTAALLLICLCS